MTDDVAVKKAIANQARKIMPQNDLDLNLMMTDPVWGMPDVSEDLKDKLKKYYAMTDQEGKQEVTEESLWGLLSMYTRDLRLANLSVWDGELNYVNYYLDLASDLLQDGKVEPFLCALSKAASRLELSQSKGGFLRRRMNTFTQEGFQKSSEPPKKSLFGGSKKEVY